MKFTPLFAVLAIPTFIPWSQFKDQKLSALKDQQKIKIGISSKNSNCTVIKKQFDTTLALTEASRAFGLSNRKKPLNSNEAMLFVFEFPREAGFWMKETFIPLQIAFINAQNKITKVESMQVEADPEQPKKLYKSPPQTVAAIEVAPHALEKAENQVLCVENH